MPESAAYTAIADWAGSTAGTATLATVGSTLVASQIAQANAPKPPAAPAAPPPLQAPNGEAAANGAAARARGAAGAGSTNITGPQGLTMPATTANKTLLGS